MKVIYSDGKEESFDANVLEDGNTLDGMVSLIKRHYDKDDNYDEDEDDEIAMINLSHIRCIIMD